MKMSNVHERMIAAPAARVGALLDTLASAEDRFWPHENWPRVKFNLPLQVGATGGHGTGPYTVSSYTLGRPIRFKTADRARSISLTAVTGTTRSNPPPPPQSLQTLGPSCGPIQPGGRDKR